MKPCTFCGGKVIEIKQDVKRIISGITIIRKNKKVKKCTSCGQRFYPGGLMLDIAEEAQKLLKRTV